MAENLTQLEDGRWLVTGTLRSAADIYHRHTGEEYAPHEATVLVSPDLLSSLPEIVRLSGFDKFIRYLEHRRENKAFADRLKEEEKGK